MTTETKLADCPFCGDQPLIYTPPILLGDDDADVDWLQVVCGCMASGPRFPFRDHNRKSENYISVRSKAIAAWNQRTAKTYADGLEQLHNAAFVLSYFLRESGFLENDKHRVAYERLVAAIRAIAREMCDEK